MDLTGRVIVVLPERSGVSARGEWKSQDFVIEYNNAGQYPRKLAFSVFGADRLSRFNIQLGQDVTVSFDLDAREYEGRWYTSVRAYDVRPAAQGAPVMAATASTAQVQTTPAQAAQSSGAVSTDDQTELPF